jgi:uncharacterized membrane protein
MLFKLGLLASICLNIALVAYIAVNLQANEPELPALRNAQQLIRALEDRLPARDAEVLREVYRTRQPDVLAARAAYQQARMHAIVVAARRDLDREEFRAAINDVRDKRIRLGDLVTDIVQDTVERISPETRQKLVERFRLR